MWMPLLRASRLDGERQLRGSWARWHWRLHRRWRPRDRRSRRCPKTASSPRVSPRSMRSWGPAACRDRPASRSAAMGPAAGPPWRCGSRQRPRRQGLSWLGWTSRAASIRWRPSPAASDSNGWWSSPRPASMKGSRSRAHSWREGRWTCLSWTCPAVDWPKRIGPRRSVIDSTDWPRSPVARRPCS